MYIRRLIYSDFGSVVMSIILGLGLATLFRKVCKDRNCMKFEGPSIDKIKGQIFNAGSNKPKKIKDIIKIIFKHANQKNKFLKIFNKFKNKKAIGEIEYQYMDYKKVKKYFAWFPKYNFEKGIKETFDWYKKNIKKLI